MGGRGAGVRGIKKVVQKNRFEEGAGEKKAGSRV